MEAIDVTAVLTDENRVFLRRVSDTIHRFVPDAALLLFGSVARGDHSDDSDYDILVLTDCALEGDMERAVRDAVYLLELNEDVVLSLIFSDKRQWDNPLVRVSPFRQEVERDAIAL